MLNDNTRIEKFRSVSFTKDSEFFTARSKENKQNDTSYYVMNVPTVTLEASSDDSPDNVFEQSDNLPKIVDRDTDTSSARQYSIESDDVIEDILLGPMLTVQEKGDNTPSVFFELIKSFTVRIELMVYIFIFIITNSAQPLLIYLLKQCGGTPNGTYTFLLPTYLAMICIGFYPTKKTIWEENWHYPLLLSFMDVIHQVIEKAGLVLCGPSIYTIGSSTNTMFLALFSNVILKQKVSYGTWTSISLISGSIALTGIGQLDHITKYHVIGFCLVVLAGIVNSLNSVISEDILKKNEIEGPNLLYIDEHFCRLVIHMDNSPMGFIIHYAK
ncbi:hypothetical protein BdWA1_001604 [Babesia duncani]|uniref:Sugar phosphate transporter domain-containing protein n=1 Tax=Babesia duncani TaxID=323732 RepID=A0AAD9UNX6_9APIC|nr:hypothetical protein BdWA1_003945 [Babesia duncani]KAK2194942.1 hypothetical protein BdWA1_003597 [Babesia duncani]KAK2196361.1 hypothetical protein BdWA1_001604 [Babesia duncani]